MSGLCKNKDKMSCTCTLAGGVISFVLQYCLLYRCSRIKHLSKSVLLAHKREEGVEGEKVGRGRGERWRDLGMGEGEEEYFLLIEKKVIENKERRST